MEYKILINSKGVPVLVEVPDKPQLCINCSKMRREDFKESHHGTCYQNLITYEQALSTALSDEKNHVPFKDGIVVMELVRMLANNKNNFYSFGQTFDLPENIGVSFEYYEKCDVWCGGAGCVPFQPNKEKCSGNPQKKLERKLAILTPKPESVPSCGEKSVIEERLLNAFYKALQWEDGEITGVDMKTLEQRVHGILTKH